MGGIKVAMDRVIREKSVVKDAPVSKELASHLLNLSSANISQELKKSCSNIMAYHGSTSEKEYLLKRLEELMNQEKKQVNADLNARREQLREAVDTQKSDTDFLERKHQKEIELLENELESMSAPSQILSAITNAEILPRTPTPLSSEMTELEADLQCCACDLICKPPLKIYQCPEGDLLCQKCKEHPDLTKCPDCGMELAGQISRNKVLENIAAKYFQT